MERDVHQSAVAYGPHARDTGNRRRVEHAVADHANAPGPFRDQHGAVGQKHHTPRMRQAFGDNGDANLLLFGRLKLEGARAERRHRQTDDRSLCVDGSKHAGQHQWKPTGGRPARDSLHDILRDEIRPARTNLTLVRPSMSADTVHDVSHSHLADALAVPVQPAAGDGGPDRGHRLDVRPADPNAEAAAAAVGGRSIRARIQVMSVESSSYDYHTTAHAGLGSLEDGSRGARVGDPGVPDWRGRAE